MAAAGVSLKLVLCGNGSVGKTSIVTRFCADGFDRKYKQTVGLEFFEKAIRFRGDSGATLQVWDIGGQSIGSRMLDKYLGGADVVFLCYDITDTRSFGDAEDWLSKVRAAEAAQAANRAKPLHVYLVGNKADLIHQRQVPQATHDAFVESEGLQGGFLVSARSGDRVTRSFYDAAGRAAGAELTDHDLAFHDKVVGVTTSAAPAPTPAEDAAIAKMRAEDAEAERRMEEAMQRELDGSARQGGCCAVA